jgi:hypothetical protein
MGFLQRTPIEAVDRLVDAKEAQRRRERQSRFRASQPGVLPPLKSPNEPPHHPFRQAPWSRILPQTFITARFGVCMCWGGPPPKPRITTNYHELPQITTNYHELPRITTNNHELPRITTNNHELPQITTNYHELPRLTTNYHK